MKHFILFYSLIIFSQINGQDFKATLNTSSFRFVDKEPIKDIRKMINGNPDYRYNQWYFDIDFDITNLSNEIIENAEVVIYLTPYFSNGNTQTFGPYNQSIYSVNNWKNHESIKVEKSFRLELSNHFKKGFMNHTPEHLYLSVYILSDNSIGYSTQVGIIKNQEIPSW